MKNRVGEKSIHKSTGQEMTLIAYRSCKDVDILFEDGSILKNRTYHNFKVGSVRHPNIRTRKPGKYLGHERIGETKVANCGKLMTIIKYRCAQDLDVQFEDGVIVRHRAYSRFRKGQIAHPNMPQLHPNQTKYPVGEQRVNKDGEIVTIIKRHPNCRIDVKFDNGEIRENVSIESFLKGNILSTNKYMRERIGTTVKAKNGLKMTVKEYNNFNDITVQFEDGTIVKHRRWQSFVRGYIGHPTIKSHKQGRNRKTRVGDTNIAHNGMKMTVIRYRDCHDIDVQFEDGTIVQHKRYSNFKKGNMTNKDTNSQKKSGGK